MRQLAVALLFSSAFLAACSGGQGEAAPESLTVEQMRAAGTQRALEERVAAATESAQLEIDRIAILAEQNSAMETQQALVSTEQAQAMAWIEITRVAGEMQRAAEREAISNTIAISETVNRSLAKQAADKAIEAGRAEVELAAAEAKANMDYWGGLALNGALALFSVGVVMLTAWLVHYGWVRYRAGLQSTVRDIQYRDSQRGMLLPNGAMLVKPEDPYGTFLIDADGTRQPTWQALGLMPPPAPQVAAPQDGEKITINTATGSHDINRPKAQTAEAEALVAFLENCRQQVGGRSPRLPSGGDYAERWGTSRSTWQNHVNSLTPQWLIARGTEGTFCASPRYKCIDALIEAVAKGEIKPAAKPRKAMVPADSVSVLTPSASD